MSGLFGSTTIKGTRITDFAQTSADVGGTIPFLYGRAPTKGNVIFAALPPKESRQVKRQGKGGVKQESFTYSTSYAIAFCRGPILGYWWIKRNGKVVYSQDPNAPIEDKDYAAKWAAKVSMYNGTSAQLPNSTIESYKGTGRVSAFKYLSYIVLPNEDVTEGGGAIPSYEAVPIAAPAEVWITSKPYAQIARDSVNTGARLGSVTLYDWLRTASSQESKTAASFVPGPGQLFEVAPPEHNDFAAAQFVPVGGELKPPPTGTFKDSAIPSFAPTSGNLAVPPLGTLQKDDVVPSFAPAGGELKEIDPAVSLLHFDGADGSTSFPDVTSRVWTRTGDTKIVTAQSRFGGASAFFDGAGDSLRSASSADFNLAAADFTSELFARFASLANAPHLLQIGNSLYNRAGLYCASGQLRWYTEVGGPYTGADRITSAALSINTWYHIAVAKQGTTTRMFIDGVLIGSTTASVYNGNSDICLGFMQYGSAGGDYLNGWIDEFRHTQGLARYTANFTPPSAPFPNP